MSGAPGESPDIEQHHRVITSRMGEAVTKFEHDLADLIQSYANIIGPDAAMMAVKIRRRLAEKGYDIRVPFAGPPFYGDVEAPR